jgi:predicted RNA-binding protein YlxR (DUF448 family)
MTMTLQGEKNKSERQCAVTRLRLASDQLLRFALDPDGNAVPDMKAKLPGRGVWITCTREVLDKAISTHVFDRGFRQSVKTSSDLVDRVTGLLERDTQQRLSMANKAGLVVSGFDKVSKVLKSDEIEYLVHASDASPDGCRKLDGQLKVIENRTKTAVLILRGLNAEQLSLALGRPNVIHAALKQGVPSQKFFMAMTRLDRFRTGNEVHAAA